MAISYQLSNNSRRSCFRQTEVYVFTIEKHFHRLVIDSVHSVYIINKRIHTGTMFMSEQFHCVFSTLFAKALHLVTSLNKIFIYLSVADFRNLGNALAVTALMISYLSQRYSSSIVIFAMRVSSFAW